MKGEIQGGMMKGKGKTKGGAKGDQGKGWGKGFGQGGGPGKGLGKGQGKGSGQGYQGQCWTCGEVGHKSNECWGVWEVTAEGEAKTGEGEVEEGAVWVINEVETNPKAQAREGR